MYLALPYFFVAICPPLLVLNGWSSCVNQFGVPIFEDHTYAAGSVCMFSCRPGYRLAGSEIRRCLNGGRWSGTATSCEEGMILTLY